jgi:glycine/D-amino acid oxidase-like deaminating enzyme
VVTSAGTVTASTVILATDAYTDDLWPGLRRTVLPVQSYQIPTQPLHDDVWRRALPGGQAVSDLRPGSGETSGRNGGLPLLHSGSARHRTPDREARIVM